MALASAATILTPRVRRLLQAAHATMLTGDGVRVGRFVFDPEEFLTKEELRVACYRETAGEPMIRRRAQAFHRVCGGWPTPIRPDEVIVGSQRGNLWRPVASTPITSAQERRYARLQQDYRDLGVAFGEGHVVCDYERVLREGLRAQVERLDALLRSAEAASRGREDARAPDPRLETWRAMRLTCEGVRLYAARYAEAARATAAQALPERAAELREIAAICERVPWEPALTFREALQSFWLLHIFLHVESPAVAISPGRLDQYLYPFYRDDLAAGRITHEQATEALACLWLKFWEGEESQNVVLGGLDAGGRDATNDLTYLMLDLTRELRAFQPSVSLRVHEGTPEDLLRAACRLAATGTGQPSFFNDRVVTAALQSIGVPAEEAWDWAIVGCYEAVVAGAEWPRTVAGGLSLPAVVLEALQARPATFDDLLALTRDLLRAHLDRCVEAANSHERHEAECAPSPFQSVLMRDCIEKGLDIYSGGARHNFTGCWPAGLATGVDSLLAVRGLVYEEAALGLDDLLALLESDFSGREDVRRLLITGAPKFGNGLTEADDLARELCELFCAEAVRCRNPRGGTFQPSLGMYQQHYRGLDTGATPDGRHAHTPFSAGVGPTQGYNTRGVTATLASCAAIPHHLAPNGNFLILSLPPELVSGPEGYERLAHLLQTYFRLGGSHLMVNVVDADTLRDAQAHPERHGDLMVRISGLSAYFVTLARHVQDDIIERTARGL